MTHVRPRGCPIIVGRETELALGADALSEAMARHGAVLLITGEAGIGKSRFGQALIERATWRGFRHLTGYCRAQDRDLPYAPFLDALYTLVHQRGTNADWALAAERRVLARILPALAAEGDELPAALPPEQERRRIFEAFAAVFLRLAAEAPLLLIIEDAHWADETSRALLPLLIRRLADAPVVLAVTARTDEPESDLAGWFGDLARDPAVARIALAPLGAPDVARMIAAMTDRPGAAVVRTIQERADGVPLLIEELVYAQTEAGEAGAGEDAAGPDVWQVPAVVTETVTRRLSRMDTQTRRVAEAAAVIGHRFSFDLLCALTRRSAPTLLAALRQLIALHLVTEASDDAHAFVFRHALMRDAIYYGLLGPERQALHRRVARALAATPRLRASLSDGELGYHAFLAEEWALAREHCTRAGEQAQALYAPHAAVEHFSRALTATERLDLSDTTLLLNRGQAYEWLGDFARASADYDTALAQARTASDSPTEWQALVSLGGVWATRDYQRATGFLQTALAVATASGDRARVARTLNNIGRFKPLIDRPADALPYYREALAIFESLGDTRGAAVTLAYLGFAHHLSADLVQGAAYHWQAVERFRAINDRGGLIENLMALAERGSSLQCDWMVPATARLRDCLPEGEEALSLARASGWRYGEGQTQSFLAFALGAYGDYARAIGYGSNALAIGEEIGHRAVQLMAHGALSAIYRDLLVAPVALRHLQRAHALARELGAVHYANTLVGYLAAAYLEGGETERAAAILADGLPPGLPRRTFSQRRIWLARAELACAKGDPARALAIIEELIATAPNIAQAPGNSIPRLDLPRAEALAALDRDDEAATVLTAAIDAARAQEARPLLWRLVCALGALHDRRGARQEAARAFDAARLLIEELAATVPDEHTRGIFLRHAFDTIPRAYRTASYRATKERYGGLTAREREIAALVAGKTNREIAETLFVSEKTVEWHVSNSLRKLGFRTRTELAAWAVSTGLAEAMTPARRTAANR